MFALAVFLVGSIGSSLAWNVGSLIASRTNSSVETRTTQQIRGSFGAAVLAVILSGAIGARRGALGSAFDLAFWWAVGFSVVAVLLSLWLPGARRERPAVGVQAEDEESPTASSVPGS
jgi:hypothetical protein